jgi:adenylosuccinate lyase
MDTATSLQLVEPAAILAGELNDLIEAIARRAIEFKYTIMIGRTHGVHAEPITFGLKLAVWMDEMRRNQRRLAEARRAIAVGKISGAVGTYATVPPEIEEKACTKLGLQPAPISTQVLQSDRHSQFVTTLAVIAGSLEKFATELRALQKLKSMRSKNPSHSGQTVLPLCRITRNPELG